MLPVEIIISTDATGERVGKSAEEFAGSEAVDSMILAVDSTLNQV